MLDRDPASQVLEDAVHAPHMQPGPGRDLGHGDATHPKLDDLSVRGGQSASIRSRSSWA